MSCRRSATSLARLAARSSTPQPSLLGRVAPHRHISLSHAVPRSYSSAAQVVGALGAGALAYALWDAKPEWTPSLPVVHAEAEPEAGFWSDPTTGTKFATTMKSATGGTLQLVGSGVRVVSFLAIRVYAVGFYADVRALQEIREGKIEGWKDFDPKMLIPPFDAGAGPLVGEALIGKLFDRPYDFAVAIIPLRSTSLPHLRDGFSRALVARLKLPQVASSLSPEASEAAANDLSLLKGYFPARPLAKGHPLFVHLSGKDSTVRFALKDKANPIKEEDLGILTNPVLARQVFMSYFSDAGVISEELRQSVARGFAGEKRE